MKPYYRRNLEKLAAYLESLPANYGKFYYGSFMEKERADLVGIDERLAINECGSSACAVGHGPSAGIRVRGDRDWNAYARRVFGVEPLDRNCDLWQSCFSGGLEGDHHDAAARIRAYLASEGRP